MITKPYIQPYISEEDIPVYNAPISEVLHLTEVTLPPNNATAVAAPLQDIPEVIITPTIIKTKPENTTFDENGIEGIYLDNGQFISLEQYYSLQAEGITIPQENITNIAPVENTQIIPEQTPVAAIQYIGEVEAQMIADEGLTIPESANVVVIPVDEIRQPELFNTVVEIKEQLPDIPVIDIVSVVEQAIQAQIDDNTQSNIAINIPVLQQVVGEVKAAEIIQEIQTDLPLKQETIDAVINSGAVTEVIKEDKKIIPIKKAGLFERLVNYIYNQLYKD